MNIHVDPPALLGKKAEVMSHYFAVQKATFKRRLKCHF